MLSWSHLTFLVPAASRAREIFFRVGAVFASPTASDPINHGLRHSGFFLNLIGGALTWCFRFAFPACVCSSVSHPSFA